jgi:hypothetical protein
MIRSARCKRPFRAYYVYSKLQAAPKRPQTCQMWSERGFTLMPSFRFVTVRKLSLSASLPAVPVHTDVQSVTRTARTLLHTTDIEIREPPRGAGSRH